VTAPLKVKLRKKGRLANVLTSSKFKTFESSLNYISILYKFVPYRILAFRLFPMKLSTIYTVIQRFYHLDQFT